MTRSQHPQHPYDKFFLTGLYADAFVSLDTTATAATGAATASALTCISTVAAASAPGACCPVHRIVLAAHSPVLCQLLTSPPARHETHTLDDCQSSVVLGVWLITASDHASLRLVLEWCYFATLSENALTPLNCWALRETAKQLQIDPLVRHVDGWIATDLLTADTDFGEDWALALKGALRSDVSDDLLARIVNAAASKSPTDQDLGYFSQPDNSNWEYQKYRYLRRTILRDDLGLDPHEIRRAFAVGVAFTKFNVPQLVEAHADEDLPRDIIAEALMRSLILRSNGNDSQEQQQNKDEQAQPPSAYYSPIRSPQQRGMRDGMTSPSVRPPPPPPRLSRPSTDHPVPLEPSPAASATSLSRQGTQDTIRPFQPRQLYDDPPMSTVLAQLRASSLDGRMSPAPRVIPQFPEAKNTLNAKGEKGHGEDEEEEPHPGDISTYELAAEWQDGESDSSPVRAPVPLSAPPDVGAFCGQKAMSSGRCSAASTSPMKRPLMGVSSAPLPASMAQIAAVTAMERRNSFGFPVPAENPAPVNGDVSASSADRLARKASVGSNTSNVLRVEKPRFIQQKRHSFHGLLEGAFGSDPQLIAPEPVRAGVSRNPAISDKSTDSSFNSTTAPEDDGPMQALLEVKRQVRLLKDRAQQDTASATMPRTSYAHAVLLNGAGYDHAATVPRAGDRPQFLDHGRRRLSTPMVLAEVRRRLEGVPDTASTGSAEATPPSLSAPNDADPPSVKQAAPTYLVDPVTALPDFALAPAAISDAPPPPPKPVDCRPRQVRKQISFAEMPTLISPDTSHDDGEDADDDEEDEFYENSNSRMMLRGGVPRRSPPPPAWDPTRAATPSLLLGLPLDAQQVLRSLTPTSMDPFNMTAPPRPGDPRPPRPAKPNAPRQPNPSVAATWAGPPPAQFIPNSSESSSVRGNEFAFLDVPTAAESGGAIGAGGAGVGNGGGGTVNGGGGTHKGSFRMLGFNAAGTVARAVKAKKRKGLVDLFKSSA